MLIETKFVALSAAGFWFLVTGLIWKLFERCEKAATDEARKIASNWMLKYKPGENISRLSDIFCNIFDDVFGKKHLSWKCFIRSCIASTISVFVVLLIWIGLRPNEAGNIDLSSSLTCICTWILILNLVPDYLSLLQTRLIVAKIKTQPKNNAIWLLIDLILTSIIAISVWLILFLVRSFFVYSLTDDSVGNFDELWATFEMILPLENDDSPDVPSPGVVFYSTFFTSVWLWLYMISGMLTQLSNSVNNVFGFINRFFFRDDQPFISLGAISIVLITCLYLMLVPVVILAA